MAATTTTTNNNTTRLSTLNPFKSRINAAFSNNNNKRGNPTASSLSQSEILYILEGCRDNVRLDGRTRSEIRQYTLLQAPLSLSNGSARILMGGGATHILCSVKSELVKPSPLSPNTGIVDLHVDLLQNQSRFMEEELQATLSKLLGTNLVNLQQLCIVPSLYVWRLGIDLLVLSGSGASVLDASSRVVRAALLNTKLPLVTPIQNSGDTASNSSGKGAQVDLSVDGDLQHATSIPGVEDCPIVVTVNVCKCPPKHTVALIVDATAKEEACASCSVRVAIDRNGQVCALHNQGPLEASLIPDIIGTAVQASKTIFAQDKLVGEDIVSQSGSVGETTLLQDQFQFR